ESFNDRIEDVLKSHHFRSGEELETTLHRYVWAYNQQLPQSALSSNTPLQEMTDRSSDNAALRKRGSLLIHCPAAHACMCERGWTTT
ncbi:integrase catalytic subunit, partial [Citreicella sp. 357]